MKPQTGWQNLPPKIRALYWLYNTTASGIIRQALVNLAMEEAE